MFSTHIYIKQVNDSPSELWNISYYKCAQAPIKMHRILIFFLSDTSASKSRHVKYIY